MIAPGITLYLARHGETEWNVARRFQGQGDSPLTARGREQARLLGSILAECCKSSSPPRFISSPAGRARHTMEIILHTLGMPADQYTTDERLAEGHVGEWSGLSFDEVQARYKAEWDAREADWWNAAPPGGESYAEMAIRAKSFLAGLKRDTVAVSHGAFGRVLRGLACDMSIEEMGELHSPQDCVHRLCGGTMATLEGAE